MNSSTLNSIKTFFRYRSRQYQLVSKSIIDDDTSCMEEKTLMQHRKSPLLDSMKSIDETIPLINQTSQPINAYTNDTRPDVDILDC